MFPFIDREHRPDDGVLVGVRGAKGEGEKQRGCGQSTCALAEIAFVQFECWLPVELVEHVVLRPRDETLWTEDVPTTVRAVANLDMVAIETKRAAQPKIPLRSNPVAAFLMPDS